MAQEGKELDSSGIGRRGRDTYIEPGYKMRDR